MLSLRINESDLPWPPVTEQADRFLTQARRPRLAARGTLTPWLISGFARQVSMMPGKGSSRRAVPASAFRRCGPACSQSSQVAPDGLHCSGYLAARRTGAELLQLGEPAEAASVKYIATLTSAYRADAKFSGDVMVARFLPLEPHDSREVAGYVLRARLGSGGMGDVFLSFTPGGRAVAIKVMRKELADDPEFRRRFRAEVSAAQRVQGLYTAPVVDADPDAPFPWLATAYVAGPSLEQAVAQYGAFPLLPAFRLLGGVAEGLAAIHAAGLVHRDLKPSNVLLAEDGPRVIDFGIAYAADAGTLTSSGMVIGTPAFMAPEQALGRTVTTATDVFALGHLVVFAATGHTAFGEGHHAAVVYRIANEAPDLKGCPVGLRHVAGRCLAKNPAERPGLAEILSYAQANLAGKTMEVAMSAWLPRPVAATLASYDMRTASSTLTRSPTAPSYRAGTGPSLTGGMTPGTLSRSRSPDSATSVAPVTVPPASRPAVPPRRRGRVRAATGALVAAAFVAGIVVALKAGHLGGSAGPGAQGTPAASQGNAASTVPGGYVAEYRHTRFTMPGGGCESGLDSTPSAGDFTGQGPQVTANPANLVGHDVVLNCYDHGAYANGHTDIWFGNLVQVAAVTGSPGAEACDTAVMRRPLPKSGSVISGTIVQFSQLHPSMQYCLISGNGSGLLVLLTLVSKSNSTYDLTWTATAWNIPSSNG